MLALIWNCHSRAQSTAAVWCVPFFGTVGLFLKTGANMVSKTKEHALDPLLVPALLALATPSIC